MRVTILGKRWRLRMVKMPKFWGRVDLPNVKHKEMHIDPRHTSGAELMDTVLHECLHCALPEWQEPHIDQLAKDLTAILQKIGYRLPVEHDAE